MKVDETEHEGNYEEQDKAARLRRKWQEAQSLKVRKPRNQASSHAAIQTDGLLIKLRQSDRPRFKS